MSTLTITSQFTLAESLRRTAPDGNALKIAQVLDKTNDIMKVMDYYEANGVNEHKEAETKSEPSGTWSDYNEHISRGATTTSANTYRLAMLQQFSTPDANLIEDAPDPMGKRMQEATGIIKGMGKSLVTGMIYGNSASDSKQMTGLAAYLASTRANVISNGGSGSDVTSIYAIAPGPDTVFMVYPRGNPSYGIDHTDMGIDIISDASTPPKDLRVYRDYFKFHGGLVVKDRRAIGRVANIETSGSSNIFDEDKIIELHYQMLEFADSLYYLANRTVLTQMHKRVKDKSNVFLNYMEAFGKPVMTLMGRPVLLCDNIVNTETAIS